MYGCSKASDPCRLMEIQEPDVQIPRLANTNPAFAKLKGVTDETIINDFMFEKSVFMHVPSDIPLLVVPEVYHIKQNLPTTRAPRRHSPFILKETKLKSIDEATYIEFKNNVPNYRYVPVDKISYIVKCMENSLQNIHAVYYSTCEVLPDQVKLVIEYTVNEDKYWLRTDVVSWVQKIIKNKEPSLETRCLLFKLRSCRYRIVFPHIIVKRDDPHLLTYVINQDKKSSLKTRVQFDACVYDKKNMSVYGASHLYDSHLDTVTFFGEYVDGEVTSKTLDHLSILKDSMHLTQTKTKRCIKLDIFT